MNSLHAFVKDMPYRRTFVTQTTLTYLLILGKTNLAVKE